MIVDVPSMLITDDDRDFRETLGGVFEARGFHTMLAEDGQEALDILLRERIHVMLVDMHMPRLTGLETIRRVKQIDAGVPCILLSGEMTEMLAEAARQAAAFASHAKPISLPEITQTVRLAMRQAYDWPGTGAR